MGNFKAIVFDLDGTLVDSAPDLAKALNALLAEERRRPVTVDEVKTMIGDGAAKLVERAFAATGEAPKDGIQGLAARFLEIGRAHV